MITRWQCTECKHVERTSPCVKNLSHVHGGKENELTPFRKAMKPRGEVTIKSLKKEVWDIFSEWVRRSEADEHGYCTCVTCGKRDIWQNFDAGHYIHGTSFLIPELVHPQCKQCNGFKAGNLIAYNKFMLEIYGQAFLNRLTFKAKGSHKLTIFGLQQYKKLYQEQLASLSGIDRKPVVINDLPF